MTGPDTASLLPATLRALGDVEVLQGGSPRGGGNLLLAVRPVGTADAPALLKVYRRRRSPLRELLQGLSHRLFEGKRGVTARARRDTEALALALWAREGFAAPRALDRPAPAGLAEPSLWIERIDGPALAFALAGPDVPWAAARALLALLGQGFTARARRAEERGEPLLIHEHGTIKHWLCEGLDPSADPPARRLVGFDLEGGYRPGFPIRAAAAAELGGLLRSIAKAVGDRVDDAFLAFASEADRALLLALATEGARGGGLYARLARWQDRRRRPWHAKTDVLARLERLLGPP
jgi:hypothetical protein